MSEELEKVVAELETLEAAATPGPWSRTSSWDIDCEGCGSETDLVCCEVKDGGDYATAYIQVCGLEGFAAPNSALIVAMRNALPALLEAAKRTAALVRDALQEEREKNKP